MKFLTLSQVTGSREDDLEIMQETTTPVIVNAEHIRSFGPRRHDKPGTLIIFANSAMFSVTEPYENIYHWLKELT